MLKKYLYSFLTLTFIFIAPISAQQRFDTSKGFTEIAKYAIPAVVSIQVKTKSKQPSISIHKGDQFDYDDPFNFFNDDFFKHFFGTPRRGGPQTQTPNVQAQASGFIITEDGYILTNAHVVQEANEINVLLNDGREFTSKVVGFDENTDVAVLKIDGKNLPHLNLGDSDDLEVGEWVATIGNPLGLQATLTVGVVSAVGRNNLDITAIEDFIQTDAAINRGNSGGPLLNLKGEVVGINTAIVSNMGSGGYMGIGFAIPSNMAQHVREQLIQNGSVTRGFLGVALQKVDQSLANAFGLNKVEGALVSEVSKDSPAEKAGLKQGDIVIEVNNQPVKNIAKLRNIVSFLPPGTKVYLTVIRDDKRMKIPVDIGKFPSKDGAIFGGVNKLGIEVENLTPELARNLGYIDLKGVVVNKVEPGSAAAWAGMKKGALIVSVNRKPVQNVSDFNESLAETSEGKPILLLVKQGEIMRYISLKVK